MSGSGGAGKKKKKISNTISQRPQTARPSLLSSPSQNPPPGLSTGPLMSLLPAPSVPSSTRPTRSTSPPPRWVAAASGAVPAGAAVGVLTKHFGAAVVARAEHEGSWLPGTLMASYGHCLVTNGGQQLRKISYEVLCHAGEQWQTTHAGVDLPGGALPVGQTAQDGVLFVGRVCILGITIMGKVLSRDRKCYIHYKKAEMGYAQYEVLVVPPHVLVALSPNIVFVGVPSTLQSLVPIKVAPNTRFRLDRRNDVEHAGSPPSAPVIMAPPVLKGVACNASVPLQTVPKFVPRLSLAPSAPPAALSTHIKVAPWARAKPQGGDVSTVPPTNVAVALQVTWVPCSNGEVAPGAVQGGKNHLGAVYVARAEHQGALIPGKLIPSYQRCYVSWRGKEVRNTKYEVLCGKSAVCWQPLGSDDPLPACSIAGGHDGAGGNFFVGRVAHGSSFTVGKVDGTTRRCLILNGGRELSYSDFEVLVAAPALQTLVAGLAGMSVGHPSAAPRVPNNRLVRQPAPLRASTSSLEDVDFRLVLLQSSDKDFEYVSSKMQHSIRSHKGIGGGFSKYRIIKVERVWNRTVWRRYVQYRERVTSENHGDANETRLFHGSLKCVEIARNGFDERHASINGMFGAGVYFAEHSSKSNLYTFGLNGGGCTAHRNSLCSTCQRTMLLCCVALGKVSEHTSAQNFAHAPQGHHSVKGVPRLLGLAYPEFIIYRGEQAFPEYLITYTIER